MWVFQRCNWSTDYNPVKLKRLESLKKTIFKTIYFIRIPTSLLVIVCEVFFTKLFGISIYDWTDAESKINSLIFKQNFHLWFFTLAWNLFLLEEVPEKSWQTWSFSKTCLGFRTFFYFSSWFFSCKSAFTWTIKTSSSYFYCFLNT